MFFNFFTKRNPSFLFFCVIVFNGCRAPSLIIQDPVIIEEKKVYSPLETKYERILGIPADSLKNIKYYEIIDGWPKHYTSFSKEITDSNGRFIQYFNKSVFQIHLPEKVQEQYSDRKVYLFKGAEYISQGDIVFFNDSGSERLKAGIYLQNDRYIYVDEENDLNISLLKDSIKKGIVKAYAKVNRK